MRVLLSLFTASLALLVLSGCDTTDEKKQKNAQKIIAQQLKDPDSAKFSNIYVVSGEQGETTHGDTWQNVAVCGYVNGKNAFGAYAGATRFIVLFKEYEKTKNNSVIIAKMERTDTESRDATVESNQTSKPESVFDKIYWNKYCVDAEHAPIFSGIDW